MKKPPRNLHQHMFNFKIVSISLLQGLGVLIASFALFVFAIKIGKSELEARSFAFVSLVIGNLFLIVINLSWSKNFHKILTTANKILYIVLAGTLVCLAAVLYLPFFSELFHLSALAWKDIVLIGAIVFISLAWFEILKLFQKWRQV